MIEEDILTGVMVNYYFTCKTKLWFFSRGLGQEDESDLVKLGRLLHEKVFNREEKEVQLERIAIDFMRKGDIIEVHEVKSKASSEEADKWQLKYYLYVLNKYGTRSKGIIHYIKDKKTVEVNDFDGIEDVLEGVRKVIEQPLPPPPKKNRFCKHCSYRDLCWVR